MVELPHSESTTKRVHLSLERQIWCASDAWMCSLANVMTMSYILGSGEESLTVVGMVCLVPTAVAAVDLDIPSLMSVSESSSMGIVCMSWVRDSEPEDSDSFVLLRYAVYK